MRFSSLALLVAIPAAAYASSLPQRLPVRNDYGCVELYQTCDLTTFCCSNPGVEVICEMAPNAASGVCSIEVYHLCL